MTPADPINLTDRHLAIALAAIAAWILILLALKYFWGWPL